MKIIISGYGKMGKELEKELSKDNNLFVVSPETKTRFEDIKEEIDCIIDFSSHLVLKDIYSYLLHKKCALIIGTTGYNLEEENIINKISKDHVVIKFSNYSKGMNLYFDLVELISKYNLSSKEILIKETHHKEKKDIPSGTALTIKEILNKDVSIESFRKEDEIGEHQVSINLNNEEIFLIHKSYSRKIFVDGVKEIIKKIGYLKNGLYGRENLNIWKEKK